MNLPKSLGYVVKIRLSKVPALLEITSIRKESSNKEDSDALYGTHDAVIVTHGQ